MAPPKKPMTAALAMQKKWQEAAVQMGGERAKIVLSKKEAKPLIFACLLDSFRPMNITAIYKELKAVVPSPVLKACLDEMSCSNDGNHGDDDPKGKSASMPDAGNKFDGKLFMKHGRNFSGTLYYVNQEKLENNGNGLSPEERNSLISHRERTSQEKGSLLGRLKGMNTETRRLLSEPSNEEAASKISGEEKQVARLEEQLKESRKFLANEKVQKDTRKRIQSLADHWWKRRRLCMDFLQMLEECTEGAVSVKKCLEGNGQVDIESDEMVVKQAEDAFKARKASHHVREQRKKQRISDDVDPTATFVAMTMDKKGYLKRVVLEGDE